MSEQKPVPQDQPKKAKKPGWMKRALEKVGDGLNDAANAAGEAIGKAMDER
jgi:hypothetical protein